MSKIKKALIITFSSLLIIMGMIQIIVEATSRDIWNGMVYQLCVIPSFSIAIGLLSTIFLEKYLLKPIGKTALNGILFWIILSFYFIFDSLVGRQNRAEFEYFLIIMLLISAIISIATILLSKKYYSVLFTVKMGVITFISSILMGIAGTLYYNGRILQLPQKWNLKDLLYATKYFYTELVGFAFVVTVGLFISYILIEIIQKLFLPANKS